MADNKQQRAPKGMRNCPSCMGPHSEADCLCTHKKMNRVRHGSKRVKKGG